MNNLKCEFCNKTFSSKYSLQTHKTTNKRCRLSRGIIDDHLECNDCCGKFLTELALKRHIKTCQVKIKNKSNQYITELKLKIKEVEMYNNVLLDSNAQLKDLKLIQTKTELKVDELEIKLKTSNDKIEELELELDYKDSKIKEMNGKLIVHEKLSETYIKHGSTNNTNNSINTNKIFE
jgi:hypothetical protein